MLREGRKKPLKLPLAPLSETKLRHSVVCCVLKYLAFLARPLFQDFFPPLKGEATMGPRMGPNFLAHVHGGASYFVCALLSVPYHPPFPLLFVVVPY